MFALSELTAPSERQSSCKLLKPWWEVFMDYLVVLMLLVSVLAGTLLLSRDRVLCLPLPSAPSNRSLAPPSGRRTNLDFQQYVYVSQVCYHEALPWYSRFFPYVALLQSLLLLASGCFWLHFPLTSSRIEHFLAILAKCCESPWTSRALSRAARLDHARGLQRRRFSLDSGTDSPLLVRCDSTSTAATSSLSSLSSSGQDPPPQAGRAAPEPPRQPAASLDGSDGEQARGLFERVRRFRAHCERSDVVYKVPVVPVLFRIICAASGGI